MPSVRTAVHDRQGLIWGYQLAAPRALGPESLATPDPSGPTWLHFNLTDARARHWLATQSGLSDGVLAVLLDPQPRVRLQTFPGGLVAILADVHYEFRGDPEGFGELRVYMDRERVITARRHPLKTIDVLRHQLDEGVAMASPAAWLEHLVVCLGRSFGELVEDLIEQVDAIEDEVVGGNATSQRSELANLRRLLVRLRRHLNADRGVLSKLSSRTLESSEKGQARMRRALERLDGIGQDLDLVHERVRLLQEELAGLLAEATNRNLYVLSVVTTVLLPATLVTGLWGMNVGGMPWGDDPSGFLWVCAVVAGSALLSLLLLRGTRVL